MTYSSISNRPSPSPAYHESRVYAAPPTPPSPQAESTTDSVINAFGSLGKLFQNIQERKREHEAELKKDQAAITKYAGELVKFGYSPDDSYNIAKMHVPHSARTFKEAQENQVRASLALNHNPAHTTIPAFAGILKNKQRALHQLANGITPEGWERTFDELDLANPEDQKYVVDKSLPSLSELAQLGVLGPDAIQSSVAALQRNLPVAQKIQYERNIKALKETVYIATDNINKMLISGQPISEAAQQQYLDLIGTIPSSEREEITKEITDRTVNFIKEARDNEGFDRIPWATYAGFILPNGNTLKDQIGYDKFEKLQDNSTYIDNLTTEFTETLNDIASEEGISFEDDPIRFNELAMEVAEKDSRFAALSEYEQKIILAEATKASDTTILSNLERDFQDGVIGVAQYKDIIDELVAKGYISLEEGNMKAAQKQRAENSKKEARRNAIAASETLGQILVRADRVEREKAARKLVGGLHTHSIGRRVKEMNGWLREGIPFSLKDPELEMDFKALKVLHADTEGGLAPETVGLIWAPLSKIVTESRIKLQNTKDSGYLHPEYFTNYMSQTYPNGYTEDQLDAALTEYNAGLEDVRQTQENINTGIDVLNDPMFKHYGFEYKPSK